MSSVPHAPVVNTLFLSSTSSVFHQLVARVHDSRIFWRNSGRTTPMHRLWSQLSPNNPSSGGIQLHNNFEALRRNDEDDVPIDGGHEVFFGDESDTESLLDSVHGGGQVVEEAIPMELRPRVVNLGLMELICLRNSIDAFTR